MNSNEVQDWLISLKREDEHLRRQILKVPVSANKGGTGVDNGTNTLTFTGNTTISGGGTISLGGFTLTVPATGTAALGTGTANSVAVWAGTNTVSTTTGLTTGAGPSVRATGATPGFWLEEDAATKGIFILQNNDGLEIQRRVLGFGAYEATLVRIDATAPGASLVIKNTGAVGIGKTPGLTGAGDLDVAGAAKIDSGLTVAKTTGTVVTIRGASGREFTVDTTDPDQLKKAQNLTFHADPTNTHASTVITFNIDGTEKARLTASPYLGVGTDSPLSGLHVEGVNSLGGITLRNSLDSVTTGLFRIQSVSTSLQFIKNTAAGGDFSTWTIPMRVIQEGAVWIGTQTGGLTGFGDLDVSGNFRVGGNTLTVPATGTAALRNVSNTFTAEQIFAPSSGTVVTIRGASGREFTVDTTNPDQLKKARTLTFHADPTNTHASTVITFNIDGTEKARLTATPRLGIGTNAPVTGLHLEGNNSLEGIALRNTNDPVTTGLYSILSTENAIQIRRNTAAGGDFSTFNRLLKIDSNGTVYINSASNANMTTGLTINQGAADNEILALKSSDVAHGVTTITETDTFLLVKKATDIGGAWLRGFRASGTVPAGVIIDGIGPADDTAKTTAARGYVELRAMIISGTSVAAPGANANLLVVRDTASTRFIVDAEGDIYYDGTANTYDEYDDVALVRALELERSPAGLVRDQFDEWIRYNRADLEAAQIATFGEDGHVFINLSALTRLHSGAIWQLFKRMARCEQALTALGVDLLQ